MSTIDELSAFFTILENRPPDEETLRVFREVCSTSSDTENDLPGYILDIVHSLRTQRIHDPKEIKSGEHGFSWLLRELQPAFPHTQFIDTQAQRECFVIHRLGLAAIINLAERETYAIVPWPEPPPPTPDDEPIILDTFDPTEEQVRLWAYALNMRLTRQDEFAALEQAHLMPLLVELAADTNCPKRTYLLAVADEYVAGASRGPYDRRLLTQLRTQVEDAQDPALSNWACDLIFLEQYINSQGPVTQDVARKLANIIMLGRHRPHLSLQEGDNGQWWRFTAFLEHDNWTFDHLYIFPASGAMRYSKTILTPEALENHKYPIRRDNALR